MISDITNSLEVNLGPLFSIHKCDAETWSLQCAYTENRFYSDIGEILCTERKLKQINKISVYWILEMLK